MYSYEELGWRTPVVAVCLALNVVCALISEGLGAAFTEGDLDTSLPLALAFMVFGLGTLGTFILAIVAVCMWTYRAMANTHALADDDSTPTISPAYAVGSYFIPFVNLAQPFRAMQVIHGAATGEVSSGILTAWWAAWIIGNILGNLSFRLDSPEAGVASALVSVFSAVFLVMLTRQIHDGQIEKERAYRLARSASVSTYRGTPGPGIPG